MLERIVLVLIIDVLTTGMTKILLSGTEKLSLSHAKCLTKILRDIKF